MLSATELRVLGRVYPASRGYIFAVWAGVQKVASADNILDPSTYGLGTISLLYMRRRALGRDCCRQPFNFLSCMLEIRHAIRKQN